jgi:hypothetical protein
MSSKRLPAFALPANTTAPAPAMDAKAMESWLRPNEAPSEPSSATPLPGKRKGTPMRAALVGERVVMYVPPEVAEALRVHCAKSRRSLSDAGTEALRLWLSK